MRRARSLLPMVLLALAATACQREKKADPAPAAVALEVAAPVDGGVNATTAKSAAAPVHGTAASKTTTVVSAIPIPDPQVTTAKAEITKTNFRQELQKLEQEPDEK